MSECALYLSLTFDYKVTYKAPKLEKCVGIYNAYFWENQGHLSTLPCVNATPVGTIYLWRMALDKIQQF